MSERTINLGTLVATARAITPILRLGGRREASRVMENLIAAVEQLYEELIKERERNDSLMRALQEEIVKGGGVR